MTRERCYRSLALSALGLVVVLMLGCAPLHPKTPAADPASPSAAANPARHQSGLYRGTFGDAAIDMTLTLDSDSDGGVHGWYVLRTASKPEHVLLAGEFEDDTLSLEESHNGVDVSGNWNAELDQNGFSGQWSDTKGEHLTDFQLRWVGPVPSNKAP